jgi:hypothetical protein
MDGGDSRTDPTGWADRLADEDATCEVCGCRLTEMRAAYGKTTCVTCEAAS